MELVRAHLPADPEGHDRTPEAAAAHLPARPRPSATSAAPKTAFTWEATDKAAALQRKGARRRGARLKALDSAR